MGYYFFKMYENKPFIRFSLKGYVNSNSLDSLMDEYCEIRDSYQLNDKILVIDMLEIELINSKSLNIIGELLKNFQKDKYIYYIVVEPENIIASYQLRRIITAKNFKAIYVKSRKEAINNINESLNKLWLNCI